MITAHEILRRARRLILDPSRWTPWAGMLDASGTRLPIGHPDEACFSALSAVERVSQGQDAMRALSALCAAVPPQESPWDFLRRCDADVRSILVLFNFEVSHSGVIALLDRAIANLEVDRSADGGLLDGPNAEQQATRGHYPSSCATCRDSACHSGRSSLSSAYPCKQTAVAPMLASGLGEPILASHARPSRAVRSARRSRGVRGNGGSLGVSCAAGAGEAKRRSSSMGGLFPS
jgi:hypothetical protein